jgi:hypothetical protein
VARSYREKSARDFQIEKTGWTSDLPKEKKTEMAFLGSWEKTS